jgi:hypothetical protein
MRRSVNHDDDQDIKMLGFPVYPMMNHRAKNSAPLGLSILLSLRANGANAAISHSNQEIVL